MAKRKHARKLFTEQVNDLKLADYEATALDGDILLWEPTAWWSRLISYGTGGPMSHVTAVVKCSGRVYSAGLEEKAGRGGMFPLRAELKRSPGKIHVYRVKGLTEEDRQRVAEALRDGIEASYGWGAIWVSFWWQIGLFRLSMFLPHWRKLYEYRVCQNDKAHESVCSQCIHRAFSIGLGRTMFVKKTGSLVTPNDIGMSSDTDYLGSLIL